MCDLPKFEDPSLLVGFETSDDAAVYKINDEMAMIQTLDFFTPIVDDPYSFGQIAAANSLSDVYAMGGIPKICMNIVGFPSCLDPLILRDILKGGADKVKEAGALLVGGHSIEDNEPKYGLSCTGMVNPDKIWRNYGAKPGDVLILTKPLGTGIIATALKEELLDEAVVDNAIFIMSYLNRYSKEVADNYSINACTDITGFGLLGHLMEMASASDVTIEINSGMLEFVDGAIDMARMGIIPGGAYRNREFVKSEVLGIEDIEEVVVDIMCDPQTSGGLLFSVPSEEADSLLLELKKNIKTACFMVGNVVEKRATFIELK